MGKLSDLESVIENFMTGTPLYKDPIILEPCLDSEESKSPLPKFTLPPFTVTGVSRSVVVDTWACPDVTNKNLLENTGVIVCLSLCFHSCIVGNQTEDVYRQANTLIRILPQRLTHVAG